MLSDRLHALQADPNLLLLLWQGVFRCQTGHRKIRLGQKHAQRIHPWRLTWNMSSWRFGSDHFRFFSRVMAVGEPAVTLPGCIRPASTSRRSQPPEVRSLDGMFFGGPKISSLVVSTHLKHISQNGNLPQPPPSINCQTVCTAQNQGFFPENYEKIHIKASFVWSIFRWKMVVTSKQWLQKKTGNSGKKKRPYFHWILVV